MTLVLACAIALPLFTPFGTFEAQFAKPVVRTPLDDVGGRPDAALSLGYYFAPDGRFRPVSDAAYECLNEAVAAAREGEFVTVLPAFLDYTRLPVTVDPAQADAAHYLITEAGSDPNAVELEDSLAFAALATDYVLGSPLAVWPVLSDTMTAFAVSRALAHAPALKRLMVGSAPDARRRAALMAFDRVFYRRMPGTLTVADGDTVVEVDNVFASRMPRGLERLKIYVRRLENPWTDSARALLRVVVWRPDAYPHGEPLTNVVVRVVTAPSFARYLEDTAWTPEEFVRLYEAPALVRLHLLGRDDVRVIVAPPTFYAGWPQDVLSPLHAKVHSRWFSSSETLRHKWPIETLYDGRFDQGFVQWVKRTLAALDERGVGGLVGGFEYRVFVVGRPPTVARTRPFGFRAGRPAPSPPSPRWPTRSTGG